MSRWNYVLRSGSCLIGQGYDGNADDARGNMVSFTITASDNRPGSDPAPAMVHVRLNVKPRDIDLSDPSEATLVSGIAHGDFTAASGSDPVMVQFQESATPAEGREVLAVLNVIDENLPMHGYGQHVVTVEGDAKDRFVITNEDPGNARYKDVDESTWQLRLKKGVTFDYETEKDADRVAEGKQIKLTITAVDGGDKMIEEKNVITITIMNDPEDGEDPQDPPTGDNVPGLSDDEGAPGTPDPDDTMDDDTDDDNDGGWTPPPPGMSVGGLIEDFIDTMDGAGQDMLDDFMLVIDDGIDIA